MTTIETPDNIATATCSDFADRSPRGLNWRIRHNSITFSSPTYRLSIGWGPRVTEKEGWAWFMDRLEEYDDDHGGTEQHWEMDSYGSLDSLDELDRLFARMEVPLVFEDADGDDMTVVLGDWYEAYTCDGTHGYDRGIIRDVDLEQRRVLIDFQASADPVWLTESQLEGGFLYSPHPDGSEPDWWGDWEDVAADEDDEDDEGDPTVESWSIPPNRQGQTVEYAYGTDEDGHPWRRIIDRSNGEVKVMYTQGSWTDNSVWEPWQREPTGIDWI